MSDNARDKRFVSVLDKRAILNIRYYTHIIGGVVPKRLPDSIEKTVQRIRREYGHYVQAKFMHGKGGGGPAG